MKTVIETSPGSRIVVTVDEARVRIMREDRCRLLHDDGTSEELGWTPDHSAGISIAREHLPALRAALNEGTPHE